MRTHWRKMNSNPPSFPPLIKGDVGGLRGILRSDKIGAATKKIRAVPIIRHGVATSFSGFFRVFFAPVLMKENAHHNQSENKKSSKNQIKSIHYYSPPLSIIIERTKNINEKNNPHINFLRANPSGATICPKTNTNITSLPISANMSATLFHCCFVSFINLIVAQIKNFVKSVRNVVVQFVRKILNLLRMLGFSILQSNNYPDNNSKKKHSAKKNVISHYTSSNALPSSDLCFLSNIKNNIQKTKIPVKCTIYFLLITLSSYHLINPSQAEARFLFFGRKKTAQEIKANKKVKLLNHKNPNERIRAAKDLVKLEGERASSHLIKRIKKEKNPRVRAEISEVLGQTENKNMAQDLIDLIKNETKPAVKQVQVLSLGQSRNPVAVAVLEKIFLDEKEDLGVRLQAGNALSYILNDESLKILEKALDNENPKIRLQAVVALGNMGRFKREYRKKLIEKMLEDSDEKIRNYTKEILREKFGYGGGTVIW